MNLSSASLLLGMQIQPSVARLLGWPTNHHKATSIAASQLHVSASASIVDWSQKLQLACLLRQGLPLALRSGSLFRSRPKTPSTILHLSLGLTWT